MLENTTEYRQKIEEMMHYINQLPAKIITSTDEYYEICHTLEEMCTYTEDKTGKLIVTKTLLDFMKNRILSNRTSIKIEADTKRILEVMKKLEEELNLTTIHTTIDLYDVRSKINELCSLDTELRNQCFEQIIQRKSFVKIDNRVDMNLIEAWAKFQRIINKSDGELRDACTFFEEGNTTPEANLKIQSAFENKSNTNIVFHYIQNRYMKHQIESYFEKKGYTKATMEIKNLIDQESPLAVVDWNQIRTQLVNHNEIKENDIKCANQFNFKYTEEDIMNEMNGIGHAENTMYIQGGLPYYTVPDNFWCFASSLVKDDWSLLALSRCIKKAKLTDQDLLNAARMIQLDNYQRIHNMCGTEKQEEIEEKKHLVQEAAKQKVLCLNEIIE